MTSILRQAGQEFNLNGPEMIRDDVEISHIGALTVDHRYQRIVDHRFVQGIVQNFDPGLVGVVVAHRRTNGRLVLIDGQHRVEALRELFGVNYRIPVQVHSGLSLESEAELFHRTNRHRKPVTPLALWKARLLAGNEDTILLNEIIQKYGLTVAAEGNRNQQPLYIHAIAALQDIARPNLSNRSMGLDFDHVDRVLSIILSAWGGRAESLQNDVLRGMSAFLKRYGHFVDERRLIAALGRDGVLDIRQRGKAIKTNFGHASAKSFGQAVAMSYNHGKREGNRLPDWDSKK